MMRGSYFTEALADQGASNVVIRDGKSYTFNNREHSDLHQLAVQGRGFVDSVLPGAVIDKNTEVKIVDHEGRNIDGRERRLDLRMNHEGKFNRQYHSNTLFS